MRSRPRSTLDDRAVSSSVTHALALGITAILISGLLLAAGTMLEDQRDNSARDQLRTVGNRIADELTRASALAQDGGNVTIRTRHPTQIAGEQYQVAMLTGAGCDDDVVTTDTCLSLSLQSGRTSVVVPVRNETAVAFDVSTTGTYTITATRNETAPSKTPPRFVRDLRIGVGDDIDRFAQGSSVNATNRNPISGFTFSPGQPTVDSVIHFRNDTRDLDGVISNYEWELGDGTTKTGVSEFDHSYASPGKYTVTLTVTDDDGETDNVSKVVSVGGLVFDPPASAQDVGPDPELDGVSFTIENKHGSSIEIQEVLVDPKDPSIGWLGTEDSTDEVSIQGDLETGDIDQESVIYSDGRIFDLDGDTARMSAGSTATVEFNGFETSSDAEVDMDGNPVDVTVRYEVDGTFYTSQFTLFSSGNVPPTPLFTASCPDETCEFDPDSSFDTDGGIEDYAWDFGDGVTTNGSSDDPVSHTFPSNGTYEVGLTVTDDDDVTSTLEKTVIVGDPDWPVVFAVNAGGGAYTASDGTVYQADTMYTGGEAVSTTDTIGNTDDEALYQTYRQADTHWLFGWLQPFEYEVPVADGEYNVTFMFAETYHTSDGQRVFDVELESNEVVSNLDVNARAGHGNAIQLERTTTVDDGELDVRFENENDRAMVSAILVERIDADAFQEDAADERVVMEAENSMSVRSGNGLDANGDDMSGDYWEVDNLGGSSGGLALDHENWDNGHSAKDTANGERRDYFVDFANTGDYYVWVRMQCSGAQSDSINFGLDTAMQTAGGSGINQHAGGMCYDDSGWTWVSHGAGGRATVNVGTSGQHRFSVWMRDDGVPIDKIVLTKDSAYTPSGQGPTESGIS